jgi:hypothetical protein
MFASQFMPCSECGASVERSASHAHQCDPARRVDFRMFAMRAEVAQVEDRIVEYLESPPGRFESWVAARDVRSRKT